MLSSSLLFVGSDSKGIDRVDGAFDEFRVSRAPRYTGDFVAARNLKRDGETTLSLTLGGTPGD